ncbi:MAG: WS/DGAT domain-containing protein, partial [Burkholderiaceae bacterium]
ALPPVANVAVSNVPGAQMPLYVCGARMLDYFPVSIPTHGVALNMTVQSYNGSLDYGLIACRRAVPDVADLADFLVEEHRKLFALAMKDAPVAVEAATHAKAVAVATPEPVTTPARKVPRKKVASKKTAANGAAVAKRASPVKTARKAVRKSRASANAVRH